MTQSSVNFIAKIVKQYTMKYEIKQELTNLLGSGHKTARNNMAFSCPFPQCPSHGIEGKQKLEVNLGTEQWHCWVCNTRGKSIKSLFYLLDKPYSLESPQYPALPKPLLFQTIEESITPIYLPKEFKAFHNTSSLGFYGKKALSYVYSRGVTDSDLVTYNLGYCEEGPYDGYIIIPNYDENGSLNYFTTRAFLPGRQKTRNPSANRKHIIGFELQLNWHLPLILVESAFNAITVKYNASPMYGSNLLSSMIRKLYEKEVSEVIFCWDRDAYNKSILAAQSLASNGIKVKVVKFPEDQDANNLGHEKTWSLINDTPYSTYQDLEYERHLSIL